LASIATRNDVIKKLYERVEGLDDLEVYSLKAGEGQVIEGRVLDKGPADELTDKKYIVIESLSGGKHYVPVGEAFNYDEVNKRGLVRVRPFDQSTSKADHNIALIAGQNEGIYDIEKHRAYIAKEQSYIDEDVREPYLQSHIKRIETLVQNEAATELGQGRYQIPDDIIEKGKEISAKINAREKKRFYPKLDILSSHAPEDMVDAKKKTWLDKELYKRSKGDRSITDQSLEGALQKRQQWLVDHKLGMIQSNGEFAMKKSAMRDLSVMEVHEEGKFLATKADLTFNDHKVSSDQAYTYLGYTELETGKWAVAMRGKELQMARIDKAPDLEKGQKVQFSEIERGLFEMRAAEQQKQQDRQQSSRGRDDDNEMEL